QTVTVGKENAGGHDQSITVAHDRSITVRNDQTLKVKNDRMVSISHDDGLYVANDRKVTVEGKQEHTTTGDHISLVKGSHSLEVKGDLARKVSGALGIKVEDDIVLESSSRISLKVGGSFVVIHPGGVDIMGPKINLNSGGSPGAPVGTMQPSLLKSLSDEDSGSEDSGGANESDQTTTEPELNHMFGSIKGIDGIQSKELVFRRFTEEE
ncbi:type VI secretion system tip protein VgrG, partial [Salmonella enterica]|nr:type VI secretion system tip protein VgrG [Salmonella enterica]